MAKQIINIGQSANDNSGDPLRTAFSKINDNFTELYNTSNIYIQKTVAPITSKGVIGNTEGMVAFDNTNFYYCKQDFTDGLDDIWVKTPWASTSW